MRSSCWWLTRRPAVIAKKIRAAKTDSIAGLSLDPARPEARNLLSIYAAVTGMTPEAAAADAASLSWGEFKPRLADAVVEHLRPVQTAHAAIMADPGALDAVLAAGAAKAGAVANATLADARSAMGFVPPLR